MLREQPRRSPPASLSCGELRAGSNCGSVGRRNMKHTSTRIGLLALGAVMLVGLLALVGCQSDHPDVKQAVYSALNQHDMASVEVFQDRRKGEITLRGIVGSSDQKAQADRIAQQA